MATTLFLRFAVVTSWLLVFFFNFPTRHLQIRDSFPCLPRPERLGHRCVLTGSYFLPHPLNSTAFSKRPETPVSRFTHEFFHPWATQTHVPTPLHPPTPRGWKKPRLGCLRRRFRPFKLVLTYPFLPQLQKQFSRSNFAPRSSKLVQMKEGVELFRLQAIRGSDVACGLQKTLCSVGI